MKRNCWNEAVGRECQGWGLTVTAWNSHSFKKGRKSVRENTECCRVGAGLVGRWLTDIPILAHCRYSAPVSPSRFPLSLLEVVAAEYILWRRSVRRKEEKEGAEGHEKEAISHEFLLFIYLIPD